MHVAVEDFGLAFAPNTSQGDIQYLIDQRVRIEKGLTDGLDRPSAKELNTYGRKIADVLLAGPVNDLYFAVNGGRIQITLITADNDLKRIPWEYLVWPDVKEGPHAERTLARIVPMATGSRPTPRELKGAPLRVLLIGADVIGLDRIPWDETKARLEDVFGLRAGNVNARVQLDIVEGATRADVKEAIERQRYDIVHFLGHGRADGILLRGRGTQQGTVFTTEAFCPLLSRSSPSLLILSACETARHRHSAARIDCRSVCDDRSARGCCQSNAHFGRRDCRFQRGALSITAKSWKHRRRGQ
jgi:hypothetical protein